MTDSNSSIMSMTHFNLVLNYNYMYFTSNSKLNPLHCMIARLIPELVLLTISQFDVEEGGRELMYCCQEGK